MRTKHEVTISTDVTISLSDVFDELYVSDILAHVDKYDLLSEIPIEDIIGHLEDNGYKVDTSEGME